MDGATRALREYDLHEVEELIAANARALGEKRL